MDDERHEDRSRNKGPGGPLGDLFERILGDDDNSVRHQIDRNARALAQSALSRLDVVSREEFDAQTALLARTRQRVEELETELERLNAILEGQSPEA